MPQVLTSDELGELGESLFAKLCAQAKLVCNKASRDRTGWDFRVELPMAQAVSETLDQRAPRTCLVQLKSTAGETGSVRARLSAMERLAKDAGPSAIVVFRMRPDGTELMGYVIHLLGKELAKVLRRLRLAERDGRTDINHVWMSFDYRKGVRFKPDADGLREALEQISPSSVDAYVAEKRHQLATLGYEDGVGVEAEALMYIEDEDHFIKLISGLAPLKPLRMKSYDRRFGIRVPYKGSLLEGIDEFPIDLPSIGPCNIIVRGGPLRPAALFECEAFVPFPVEGGPLLAIRHPALSVFFTEGGLNFESAGNFKVDRHDLFTWIQLLRTLAYFAEGGATVELDFRGARIPGTSVGEGLDGPYLDQLPSLLDFVERLQRALELAGLPAPEAFALEDIWAASDMQMSLDMCFNPRSAARFEFDAIDGVTDAARLEALFYNSVAFAGAALSFATKVRLDRMGLGTSYASSAFDLLDVRPAVLDLDDYGAQMAHAHGLSIVIDPANVTMVDPPRGASG